MALQHEYANTLSEPLTDEATLRARYRFFRQCFDDKNIFDASCYGWGSNFIAVCAERVQALCDDPVEIITLSGQFPNVDYTLEPTTGDEQIYINLTGVDASTLSEVAQSYASAIVSWDVATGSSAEFEAAVSSVYPSSTIQYFSQTTGWPTPCKGGLDEEAVCWIAAVGPFDPISWPSVGISIPTIENAEDAVFAVQKFIEQYPGELRFAIVANGSSEVAWARLNQAASNWGARATLIHLDENLGYGLGCNRGLLALKEAGECDFYAVMNDDVVPAEGCLTEMVMAMRQLHSLDYKPGVIAPHSDNINGCQQVRLPITSVATIDQDTEPFRREKHSSGRQELQLRGLFLLIHPDCLEKVGGFDPRFGIGNFEDDDHNLRTRLAGFTLWIAEGAFLHHKGSKTFQKLGIDYNANIQRNGETFGEKWQIMHLEEWPALETYPEDVNLHVPLDFDFTDKHVTKINGEMIDLVHQAGEIEFAAWVMNAMRAHPRAKRREVIDCILRLSA